MNRGHDIHACVDPGIPVRGGGGPSPTGRKQPGQRFVFVLVLNLFYSLQRESNGFITEKTILFQGSRGVQHFPEGGGGPTFSQEGGLNANSQMDL